MGKLVVAVEGPDGSGKGTLIRYIWSLAEQRGIPMRVVGRNRQDAGEVPGKITEIVQEHADDLSAETDFHLRLAREYQRAQLASEMATGLVILDRFVLSVLSRVIVQGIDPEEARRQLSGPFWLAGVKATIYVECPFEVAWGRVQAAAEEGERRISPKEKRGKEFNRRLSDRLAMEYNQGTHTGEQWRIDNSGSVDAAEKQVACCFQPWLTDMA